MKTITLSCGKLRSLRMPVHGFTVTPVVNEVACLPFLFEAGGYARTYNSREDS